MRSGLIRNKYKNISEPVKASIAFVICNVLQKGISTLTLPIFTRLLTTEQYGVFSVYSSWYEIISIFATLNLFLGVFNNGMVKYEDDRDRYQSSMLGLSTTVTILVAVIYTVCADFWDSILQLDRIFIILMLVELIFVPAFQFWSTRQRFSYRYKALVAITIGMSLASPVIGVIAVLSTEHKAEARVFSYVLVQVVVGIFFYIKTFKNSKTFFYKQYWKFALAFNIPLIPHYLSGVVLNQADRIMINSMVGTGYAAIYSVAYNLAYMVSMVTTSINNSFVPYTYQKLKTNETEKIRQYSKATSLIVAIPIILIMAFGPELIKIFATKDYYEAIWIIPPVSTSVFITFMYGLFVNIEFYFEANKFIMIASSMGALLNIILNKVFIEKYGFVAAGYTTLVCYIVFMLAHYFFYLRVIKANKIHQIYDIRYFVGIVIAVLATMFAMLYLYNHIVIRYCLITIMIFIAFSFRKKIIVLLRELKNK